MITTVCQATTLSAHCFPFYYVVLIVPLTQSYVHEHCPLWVGADPPEDLSDGLLTAWVPQLLDTSRRQGLIWLTAKCPVSRVVPQTEGSQSILVECFPKQIYSGVSKINPLEVFLISVIPRILECCDLNWETANQGLWICLGGTKR